jgi:recombination protein RecT
MSTNAIATIDNLKQILAQVEPDFASLAKIHGAEFTFEREASFALQLLKENEYLARVAMADPDSFKRAIINVAAIGLSLSPVHKLAYLVPRKKICLDISYRGLVKLATDAGSIKWVHADIVCENDLFEFRGFGKEPLHQFKAFEDRGPGVGAYCVAKTADGDFLVTTMSAAEIIAIKNRSEAGSKGSGPWDTDGNEMAKKTVIKRASKLWPMTDVRKRFDMAIDVSGEVDPIDFNSSPHLASGTSQREQKLLSVRELLTESGRTEEKFIAHLGRTYKRKIEKLEDMTDSETSQAIIFLTSLVEKERAKKSKETAIDNAG